eukprot:SM000029S10516  [mRNA]  locus=s29:502959:503592:- [translate_table: standard]
MPPSALSSSYRRKRRAIVGFCRVPPPRYGPLSEADADASLWLPVTLYYRNQAFEDTLEDVERNEIELVPGADEYDVLQALYDKNVDTPHACCSHWPIGQAIDHCGSLCPPIIGGWAAGNKLGTAPGPKTVKYILWPAMLEHAFVHSDVVHCPPLLSLLACCPSCKTFIAGP